MFSTLICFPICSNFLSPECYISQADQCNVVFDRAATRQMLVPLMCSLIYYQHLNQQTLLLIITPTLRLYITLWNAHTSYEMSPQFLSKKDPDVKASKHLSINTWKKEQVYLADFLDPRRWVEVSGERNILKLNSLPSQEFARGALKQCREIRASSLHLPQDLQLLTSAAVANPYFVRSSLESSIILALVDWGKTLAAGWHGLL